ncbi:sigma-54-dependent Fis family transcriptional regulator [Pseudoxanthomonas jiangsuensis]|uniref:sigma-54-dependent transcriptional regulator n=1 Tax=Pseudoxanthomonas jiangsuensis TaxID=619688 RepID=UPI001391F86B|nr:sigma-54 dependent transcriptional regulator [Pseudoxanthomonas jiangsuensis]KAF1699401.1 sigma-54-dependent Fis family transcriptional regulator [Pseudoxanthomonas jiangsuensis]
MPTILVIDDNPAVATALEVLFSLHDLETRHAPSPAAGLALLDAEDVDLVVQDMNFSADTTSGDEGRELFAAIRARHPDLPVILLTAWTHLESAVELIKAGAADYVAKPWQDAKLLATVNNLLELAEARRELDQRRDGERRRRDDLARRYDLRGAVFADAASERVVALACQVARSELPVLVTGPNGSGKEKIAEIIQANSAVREGPFVTVNCGALPAELIEAELFGAEAGAYTGANKAREGKFEAADGGTLFLDEIGNLPPAGQMKLLRVLETGRFARLGSNRERQVKVRVVSATNADLPAMIREGAFREDLYYRLNTLELAMPPLAERPGDILPLAERFGAGGPPLSAAAASALQRHPWPGNVRELRNVIQRAQLLAAGPRIEVADLGLPKTAPVRQAPAREPEREQIEAALERAGGVIAQAASELGMSRQALYRRMERHGLKAS